MPIRPTGKERREQIVRATLELLAGLPIDQVSTRKIARRVGISQPALFRHFRTTQDILRTVVDRARQDLASKAETLLGGDHDPLQAISIVVLGLAGHMQDNPALPRLSFHQVTAPHSPLGADLHHLSSMVNALVGELLREAMRAGLVPPTLDCDAASSCLLASVQGMALHWLSDQSQHDLRHDVSTSLKMFEVAVRAGVPQMLHTTTPQPAAGPIATLDVRPLLSSGTDPLRAVLELLSDDLAILRLWVPFRPSPLIALLKKRGWNIDVHETDGLHQVDVCAKDIDRVLYLADLQVPEPLERVLATSNALTPGSRFVAHVPRVPRLVLPRLSGMGLTWTVSQMPDGTALLLVEAR
jgi:AcrR family transcriptional regulator